jgi:hypothetical protein
MEFEAQKERLVDKEVMPTQEIINHFMGNACFSITRI